MIASDLRAVGISVFLLLAKRRKSLAPVARAVHAAFELKHGLDRLSQSDEHPGISRSDMKWRLPLVRIKAETAQRIRAIPPGAFREGHLHRLKFWVLDELAASAEELGDLKTSAGISAVRVHEVERIGTNAAIARVTRAPLQDFTE